jgi:hypothetical protein
MPSSAATRSNALARRIESSGVLSNSACVSCRRMSRQCIRSSGSVRCSSCVRLNRRCIPFVSHDGHDQHVSMVLADIRRLRTSLCSLERLILCRDSHLDASLVSDDAVPMAAIVPDAPGSIDGTADSVAGTVLNGCSDVESPVDVTASPIAESFSNSLGRPSHNGTFLDTSSLLNPCSSSSSSPRRFLSYCSFYYGSNLV